MRYAPVLMILVLSGCSEWNLRSLIGSNALGPDTGHTGLDDPLSRGDTAPPDDQRSGRGLPTHCNPPSDPLMKPVWDPKEGPSYLGNPLVGQFDFDVQGRLVWVEDGKLHWADRSGTHGILDPDWGYPFMSSIKALPNGSLVVSSIARLLVRDPDAGVTRLSFDEEELGDRRREYDTIEVDTDNHFYSEYESGSVLRFSSTVERAERLANRYWRPVGSTREQLHFALTPNEELLYVLAKGWSGYPQSARLYRIERDGEEWLAPDLVWEDTSYLSPVASLAVDECGNAIVLQSTFLPDQSSTTLWYVPLKGKTRQFLHLEGYAVSHLQWGNGRFGWDASSLYMWAWPQGEGAGGRLYQVSVGVKGNHVLTRNRKESP